MTRRDWLWVERRAAEIAISGPATWGEVDGRAMWTGRPAFAANRIRHTPYYRREWAGYLAGVIGKR